PLILIGHDNGVLLREFAAASPGRTVSLDPGFVEYDATDYADYVAYFSSQGPAIGTGGFKPDLVAPGTDLYAATQMFDDQGDMFDKSGYTAVQGTSFAVPLVAGAVALSRQFFPGLVRFPENQRAAILKSSVVNTADPEIYDVNSNGETIYASVVAMGSGKLDAESALATLVTVSPATLSFGVLSDKEWPVRRSLVFRNHSAAPLTLSLSRERWTDDNRGQITITPSIFVLQAGAESQPVKIELGGQAPASGRYEGVIKVGGAGAPFQIPFLYLVGDGVPHNMIPVRNGSFTGQVDKSLRGGLLFKVVDRYGVPVANVPVKWRVVTGGGEITAAHPTLSDPRTDVYGIGEATTLYLGD
ncbi:MAG: S8 family serine peptidase, partial [Gallionella sp.]|nr:S8 family serine peptidase [Gallionella sp.]